MRKYLIGGAFAAPVVGSFFLANSSEGLAAGTCISSNSTTCYEYFGPSTDPAFEVFDHTTSSIKGEMVAPLADNKRAGVLGTGPDVGVYAASTGGFALAVAGRPQFSTTGQGTIPAGTKNYTQADSRVDANTQVVVTLTSNPGGARLGWVETVAGTGFVIHLQGSATSPVTFDYYLVWRP